ncbi:hypothetical protein Pan161_09440 [Gimesia algae]|uniref:Uncharacterized protein n=1 Tax=Gimesia algae TaxID=2527971 RepID=A0A517V8I0_9PLAN|nr:hypothetical protein Pan161_09440 [Gimesia algae]
MSSLLVDLNAIPAAIAQGTGSDFLIEPLSAPGSWETEKY